MFKKYYNNLVQTVTLESHSSIAPKAMWPKLSWDLMRENGQGMAFPMGTKTQQEGQSASSQGALSAVAVSADAPPEGKVVQLVSSDDQEPPKPPSSPRPALKRVK